LINEVLTGIPFCSARAEPRKNHYSCILRTRAHLHAYMLLRKERWKRPKGG